MRNLWESALIALDAIWSAKLRSFMTVLGNIVAVTSIIAVTTMAGHLRVHLVTTPSAGGEGLRCSAGS